MDINLNPIIGEDKQFLSFLDQVSKVSKVDRPILVVGERGTGKELIAHRLHYLSNRWDNNFIKLNCSALTESLLESELFGHEMGAFTGAVRRKQGRFELAHKGTLFLDELGTTSLRMQEKILRVIEYGEFERIGGQKTLKTNVRIVAATNQDLPALAQKGLFRFDLLDRLSFIVLNVPPLRERPTDILVLTKHFAKKMVTELDKGYFKGFSQDIEKDLLTYSWPGNIRELKNVIERAVFETENEDSYIDSIRLNPFKQLGPEHVQHTSSPLSPLSFKETIKNYEVGLIKSALKIHQYNQKKAAEYLKLTYHQLRGLLRKYHL